MSELWPRLSKPPRFSQLFLQKDVRQNAIVNHRTIGGHDLDRSIAINRRRDTCVVAKESTNAITIDNAEVASILQQLLHIQHEIIQPLSFRFVGVSHLIFEQPSNDFTGHFLIDDTLLAERGGVTNFDHYRVTPGQPLAPEFFVPDASVPPAGVVMARLKLGLGS